MVKEEITETPDHKVIKVAEEGEPGNVQEVKDELTKEFKSI